MIASDDKVSIRSKKEPEPIMYSQKKPVDDGRGDVHTADTHNPFVITQELRNLQMPDHRHAVKGVPIVTSHEDRPESKKGFLLDTMDQMDTANDALREKMPVRPSYTSEAIPMDDLGEIEEPMPYEGEPHFGPGNELSNFLLFSLNWFTLYLVDEPMQLQNYANFEEEKKNDNNINLEDAIEIEKQLSKILECLRYEIDPTLECEEWWVVTDPSSYSLTKLPGFYKDPSVVKAIIEAQKIESISVSFIQFLSFENSLEKTFWIPFKNLIFFIHQNWLILFRFLLDRLPQAGKSNSWAIKLDKICDSKLTRLFKSKAEALQVLRVNIEWSKSVMRNISKIKPKQQIYSSIWAILDELDNFQIGRIREMLFTTIQYRAGGHIASWIDEINGFHKTSKNFVAKSKSQTSNAFTPAGGSPPTSPSLAAFFFDDELPPVQEPFLPPAEGDIYTLVLDLDETLVHYFDLGPDSRFEVRPGWDEFLSELSKYYELVIFTAAMQDYADSVLDQIDREGRIKYRLYRQHTSPYGNLIAKDLSKIGRDLAKTILIGKQSLSNTHFFI
jgi:hypothetical protein